MTSEFLGAVLARALDATTRRRLVVVAGRARRPAPHDGSTAAATEPERGLFDEAIVKAQERVHDGHPRQSMFDVFVLAVGSSCTRWRRRCRRRRRPAAVVDVAAAEAAAAGAPSVVGEAVAVAPRPLGASLGAVGGPTPLLLLVRHAADEGCVIAA